MSTFVNIRSVDTHHKFTQMCFMPLNLLQSANFKVGDCISIKCAAKTLLCTVFIQTSPDVCITADETVCYQNNKYAVNATHDLIALYPKDFQLVKTSTLKKLIVKVVYMNEKRPTPIEVLENIVRKVLSSFVLGKGFTVNCSGQKLANMFYIHSIEILYSFETDFGRLTDSTEIQINEAAMIEQMVQMSRFQNIELGGLSDIYKTLQIILFETKFRKISKTILITGPSGCGKSCLVRKFLHGENAFSVIVDGLKNQDVNIKNCDIYCEQFVNTLKLWPEKHCVLLLDHIDRLAPNNYENNNNLCEIALLMKKLQHVNVLIVATVTDKKFLHLAVRNLFEKEISIGMPSLNRRKNILEAVLKSFSMNLVDCDKIAQMTPGYVGADIVALCREAIKMKRDSENFTCQENDLAHNVETLTLEDFEKAFLVIEPSALKTSKWSLKVKPIHWDDIGGMQEIKKRLQMCIEWPLHHPDAFQKVGLPCPRGLLLFGPPGCCKTTLARGLATECNANFFAASPAQIYSPYVGESEKNIVELFSQARLCAPSIIFLDELDSLVGQRKFDSKSQGIGEKVLSTLLNEIDGFSTMSSSLNPPENQKLLEDEILLPDEQSTFEEQYSNNKVIVVAATNRPDLIDDALLRPGRFDVILYAPPPNIYERKSILETLTNGVPIKDVNMTTLAEKTELFSGADLKNLCDMAGINAVREDVSAQFITEENFLSALKEIQPSISRDQISMYEKLASKYGPVISNK